MRNTLIIIGLIILIVWGVSMIDKKRMEERKMSVQLSMPSVIVEEDEETLILVPADDTDQSTMAARTHEKLNKASNTVKDVTKESIHTIKDGYGSVTESVAQSEKSAIENIQNNTSNTVQ